MMPKFVVAVASIATALASPVCGTGVYKQPKMSSFAVVSANVGLPVNTTTSDGVTALFPLYKGSIAGKFKGHLVNGTSVVHERVLPGSDGAHSVVRTDLIFENEKEEHILVQVDGQTTYANEALHGFGRGLMQTDIAEFAWVNWATFLIEWEGFFNTGEVVFEFSEIKTGGRRDGKGIPALEGK